ncbi:hypothetical protein COI51_21750 [Bacillus toyonensis]|uniref:P-loop NTPase fold protein n=1 Tax=Bacillus cereus group TaxID=86661 RepID=UPI000BF14613|nr:MULTISPECIES: P-loop NTPase fold protein [Bacillus cereus group]PEM13357.1 hypothetical protein CN616_25200 [Bacillus toyonensis]PGA39905.1 hypothetical protein COL85_26875 [Bacillus toyonensis]PGB24964.1 hypothetical protein COM06_19460 [Bacillus toyonensis]PGC36720.1 hypothetical protein COM10_12615 [Bacillus toyonensis]PGK77496.1 hypothetical protein CN919_15730 [Bacillus thuringiensis]
MELIQFIENLFANETNLEKKMVIKEINGMKNSQPPEKPTFIINQNETKSRLTQKLTDCMHGYGFEHIVLTGKVGGGKTHFLNWIESRMNENGNFYMVKFQVQETSTVKHSFVKMIVSKIFQQYYEDFTYAMNLLAKEFEGELAGEQDQVIGILCNRYRVSSDLARLLYAVCAKTKKESAAIRVMGASHGRTELSRLGIKNLTDSDYIKIIQFFLQHKKKDGYLLVLLDEFEHAYLSLTPAARRNFFTSYKAFIDEAVRFDPASLVLVTSVTEQYEGHLQEKVGSAELALWSRIQHQVNALSEFSPANLSEFKELFNELSVRYKVAYDYDIYAKNELEMRKRFLERLGGDTAQPISYRDAILNMLGIMDDLRMNKQTLEISTDTRIEYEKMIQEAKKQWEDAHHNAKTGIIKSSLEKLLMELGYEKLHLKDELGSVLFVSNLGTRKLLYISTVSNSKSLATSIDKCIKYKDNLSSKDDDFETIFIYQKQWETKAIAQMLSLHPDIHGLAITELELYNLFAYKNVKDEVSKEKMVSELERVINDIK